MRIFSVRSPGMGVWALLEGGFSFLCVAASQWPLITPQAPQSPPGLAKKLLRRLAISNLGMPQNAPLRPGARAFAFAAGRSCC
jgi:hypothetical protein